MIQDNTTLIVMVVGVLIYLGVMTVIKIRNKRKIIKAGGGKR